MARVLLPLPDADGQLGAADEPERPDAAMTRVEAFRAPIAWDAVRPDDSAALLLPGGHAPGTRQYPGSAALQQQVGELWALDRPMGIRHGVPVLARTLDPTTGRSVPVDRVRSGSQEEWSSTRAEGASAGQP